MPKKETTTAKLDRLTGIVDALAAHDNKTDKRLDRLEVVIEALAASVVARDNQLDRLMLLADKQWKETQALERRWQAYLNTLPRQ
jgi:chemotaxis regulatin CheY-phosphate phosphatase CheZ